MALPDIEIARGPFPLPLALGPPILPRSGCRTIAGRDPLVCSRAVLGQSPQASNPGAYSHLRKAFATRAAKGKVYVPEAHIH